MEMDGSAVSTKSKKIGVALATALRHKARLIAATRDAGGNYGPIINTVDVTGRTYGLINPQTPGNIIETCTLVTDQSGLYDVYAIDLKFNIFDGRFNSLWTHQ